MLTCWHSVDGGVHVESTVLGRVTGDALALLPSFNIGSSRQWYMMDDHKKQTEDLESDCSITYFFYFYCAFVRCHLISIVTFWPSSRLWNQKLSEEINQFVWRCFPEDLSKTTLFHIIYILGGKKNQWRDKFSLAVTSQHKTGQHSTACNSMKWKNIIDERNMFHIS